MSKKGSIPWNKGKKGLQFHSEETKKRLSEIHKKIILPQSFKKGHHPMTEFKKDSEFCKKYRFKKGIHPLTEFKKGQPHYNWKGGITPINHQIRNCFEYRQWSSDVFTRDNFICQHCGKRGCYLEVHHIKQFSKIRDENNIKTLEQALNCAELWNINNGMTLCRECHDKTK